MKELAIDPNNKEILDELVKSSPEIKQMTYIELGIFLEKQGYKTDWLSLSDAHEYLGGYENEERDKQFQEDLEKEIDRVVEMDYKPQGNRKNCFVPDIVGAAIFETVKINLLMHRRMLEKK